MSGSTTDGGSLRLAGQLIALPRIATGTKRSSAWTTSSAPVVRVSVRLFIKSSLRGAHQGRPYV